MLRIPALLFALVLLLPRPGHAQEPDTLLILRAAAEVGAMVELIAVQRSTIDSLLALPGGDPELAARVDSLVAVLSVERASHAAVVDSLELVIAEPDVGGLRLTATAAGPASITVAHRDLLASATASTVIVEPVIVDPPDPGEDVTPTALRKILGPLVARGTVQDTILSRFDSRFQQTEQARFCGGANSYKLDCATLTGGQGRISSQHYGALLSRLNWSIRNGEPYGSNAAGASTAYGRGRMIVHDYLHNYAAPNQHGIQPHNNTGLADIAAYYLLEGDPVARQHIWVEAMAGGSDTNGYMNFTNSNSDGRQPAVRLQAVRLAHELGIPFQRAPNTSRGMDMSHGSWIGTGRWLIDHMLTPTGDPNRGYIAATGAVWSTAHAGQAGGARNEAYLFNAMLATALLQWWGWTDQYAPAYAAAKRIMDHILDIDDAARAAGRTTIPYLTNSGGSSLAAEELASFYVWPALVLWRETNDARYRTFAMRQMAAANRTSSISAVKQWNQVFSLHTQGAGALLSGVSWR